MTDDEYVEQPAQDDGPEEHTELTPGQGENLRRAIASVQQSLTPKMNLLTPVLPEAVLKNVTGITGMVEAQRQIFADAIKPMLDAHAVWQRQVSAVIATDAFRNIALPQSEIGRIAEQVTRSIDASSSLSGRCGRPTSSSSSATATECRGPSAGTPRCMRSARQYNRRNAVQGAMLVCSLLYRLDEEAVAREAST